MKLPVQQLIWCLLSIMLCLQAFAQGTVKGKVIDQDNFEVIGGTVLIEGTERGAATDMNGEFTILNVPAGTHTVVVSYIGYEDARKQVTVGEGGTATIDFKLGENTELLNEVVVVGYGTQRKRDVVGSISKVESKELLDVVGGSFENVLQGKVAGAQITQSSGIAGAGSMVRLRGVSTISSGGEPLYVVDGIPITQDNFLTGSSNGQNNNPLSSLNPNDIESVEVLKDASAAAIYGSRGANGVILITTKRGQSGAKPTFNFSTRWGLSQPANRVEFLDSEEWLQIRQEAWENDGNVGRAPLPGVLADNGYTYESIEGINTDWIDEVIQTGFKQEYNLSMNQGGKKLSSYIGGSYSDAQSYLVGNSYKRASLRGNIDYRFSEKFTSSISTSITRGLNNRIPQAWAGGLGTAQTSALPIYPIMDTDSTYFNLYGNPVAQRELTSNKTREWRSINNVSLTYSPIKRLALNVTGSYDYMNIGDYFFEDAVWTDNQNIAKGFTSKVHNWSTYGTATYDVKMPNPDHTFKAMIGTEYQRSFQNGTNEEYQGLTDHLFRNPEQQMTYDTLRYETYGIVNSSRFFSLFGRLNYSYKDKFLAQAVYRSDASSKFGPKRRVGGFPSVGLGYILSEEPFLKESNTINFLKIKASWGKTGNADIPSNEQYHDRLYGDRIGPNDYYNNEPIRFERKLENPYLQWEVVTTYDGGIEIGLFEDRITAAFSYYYKKTTEAVIQNRLQASTGIEDLFFWENVASLENKGFEIELTTRNLVKKFKWKTDLNLARNTNKILSVASATPDALAGGFGDTRVVVGEPIGVNYLIPFSHIDAETGAPVYLDQDGNETFIYDVVNNRRTTGDIFPKVTGGITNTFNYKNVDLSFLWTFSIGGTIYDDAAKRSLGVVTDWNMQKGVFDRWREPGDDATYPKLTMDMTNWGGNSNFWQNNHSLWLYDATYARLKNITIGYTKKIKAENSPIKSYRIFVNSTNLWTITKYPGWDPEISRDRDNAQERNVGGVGVTYLTPPQERTFNLGVNFTFQ